MADIKLTDIKTLRDRTSCGVMDARAALTEAKGDMEKAVKILSKQAEKKAAKKVDREVTAGRVYAYTHQTGKLAVLVEIACETDFVARNAEFENLCKEVALQVASMDPENVEELLDQDYVRDGSRKISSLVKDVVGKTGENIKIVKFVRMEIGGK
jgi:elongation factor Ts